MEARLDGGEVIVTSRNAHKVVLQLISRELSPEQISKGGFKVILCYVDVPESFLLDFWEHFGFVDKCVLSSHQKLSEDFIYNKRDELSWRYISKYQKLSESLIRNLSDYVAWDNILTHQELSPQFREEFREVATEWIARYGSPSDNVVLGKFTNVISNNDTNTKIEVVSKKIDKPKKKKADKHKGYKKPEKYKNYYSDII